MIDPIQLDLPEFVKNQPINAPLKSMSFGRIIFLRRYRKWGQFGRKATYFGKKQTIRAIRANRVSESTLISFLYPRWR